MCRLAKRYIYVNALLTRQVLDQVEEEFSLSMRKQPSLSP